ncbi:hypothetical protein [Pantoea sp. Tr-811]|uniref:hypothetical protein n=1 Tax=Pantoea sp. Tr-811 TaxID=2608361 RepID=UPI001963D410|nr:hypothetical protein [Pantoea sp. Tr-811]
MQQKAIETSGNPAISFEHVAQAALRGGPDGQKIRQTIDTLAEHEAQWLRNTPPHTLKSDRVMQSRKAEVSAFTAIHQAVISTVAFEAAGPAEKPEAERGLHQALQGAYEAIDNSPGSRGDREGLLASMRDQVAACTSDDTFIQRTLRDSERTYLAADLDKTLARYNSPTLPRSEGLDDYSL